MPVQRITDATVEPVDLAAAKRHLREDLVDPDNDADIEGMIVTARHSAEHRLQRTLITSTWQLTLDAWPDCFTGFKDGLIRLPMGRVLSVQSVKYINADGTLTTLAADQYLVDLTGDVARIGPAYGLSWPVARWQPAAIQVNYTAGYGPAADDVPAPIKAWIKLAVGDLYEQRSRSVERVGPSGRQASVVPNDFADGLLDPYKIWSL